MNSNTEKGHNLLHSLTNLYIFIIIVIFPLIVDKTGFFKILECKWNSYVIISTIYISMITIINIYYYIRYKTVIFKKKFTLIEWLALVFLIVNILSCFLSPYYGKYNLWIGTGRGEGLLISSLYIISFLFVANYGKFDKKQLFYFSISSIFVSSIAVLQFIGFNPFNMYQDGIGTHNVSFMTTIGNVDFISAYYTITLTISASMLLFLENTKTERLINYFSILLGSFIFLIIEVNSGKVAFMAIIALLLPYIFKSNKNLAIFLKIIAIILLGIAINMFINIEYHYDIGKLGFYFKLDYLLILMLLMIFILLFLSRYLNNISYDIKSKNYLKLWYFGYLIIGIFGLLVLYIIPFKNGMLYEIHELLHFNFNDDFGTYRIFLWKRTIPLIKDYPILGTGPDTFALRFMPLYSNDIAAIGPLTINDTAANIYLTIFVNLGIVGGITYIIFLGLQIYYGIKKYNNYSLILLLAIICYMVGSFFNLSVVIVSPLFWVLMGIHHLCIYNNE